MAANLRLYSLKGATYFSLEESIRNTIGTPLVSVAKAGNNLQRAGLWTLTFQTVVPAVSATCIVSSADPHDPSRNLTGVTVSLNGTTVHTNIVQGLGLVFSNGGGFNSTWEAKVYYGVFYDTSDSTENSILRVGTVVAGADSTPRRLAVRNDGSDLSAASEVTVVNAITVTAGSGTPVKTLAYTEQNAIANFTPGYAITFANRVAGPPVLIDVRIDGSTYDMMRMDTGVIYPGGAGVVADGNTVLQWVSGPLTGIQVILNTSVANTDTINFKVSDASSKVQTAPDMGGAPGTWQSGIVPLALTEDGWNVNGEIRAGMIAFYWQRVHTMATDSPIGNQRVGRIILKGLGT